MTMELNKLLELRPSCDAKSCSATKEIQAEDPLPFSQKPVIGLHPEPDEPSLYHHLVSL
jgi:hypothetical protein